MQSASGTAECVANCAFSEPALRSSGSLNLKFETESTEQWQWLGRNHPLIAGPFRLLLRVKHGALRDTMGQVPRAWGCPVKRQRWSAGESLGSKANWKLPAVRLRMRTSRSSAWKPPSTPAPKLRDSRYHVVYGSHNDLAPALLDKILTFHSPMQAVQTGVSK